MEMRSSAHMLLLAEQFVRRSGWVHSDRKTVPLDGHRTRQDAPVLMRIRLGQRVEGQITTSSETFPYWKLADSATKFESDDLNRIDDGPCGREITLLKSPPCSRAPNRTSSVSTIARETAKSQSILHHKHINSMPTSKHSQLPPVPSTFTKQRKPTTRRCSTTRLL